MPCEFSRDENGSITKIVCSGGAPRCKFCGKRSSKLCDYATGTGPHGTCDAQICNTCAFRIGPDCDVCPPHRERLRETFEERAGIKEHMGGMTREEAERQAHEEVYGRKPGKPEQLKLGR